MTLILLLLVPLLAGLFCWPLHSRPAWERSNLLSSLAVVVLACALGREVVQNGPVEMLGGFLRADALSALVIGLTAFVSLVCAVYAVGYFREDEHAGRVTPKQLQHYYLLTPLLVFSMNLVVLANNLGMMWVATEATTLASVLLVAFYKNKSSLEAGWKYIIIGSIGISLALFGTILTYHSAIGVLGTDEAHGLNWSVLVTVADQCNPTAMRLGFVMVLLGYGTKAGLAPMHTWKPDAYAEAPVPAAAMLGAGVINCAIYGIIRFHTLAEKCLGHEFSSNLLIGFGIFSILLAAPFVLVQRNFRRLLAYSSIDHAGIMAAAIGFGGKLGALGVTLHLLFHTITKPLMFFCAGNIQQHFGTPHMRKVSGAVHTLPWTGALFLIATLAVTGMPPFGIFQSELTTLTAGFAAHHAWAASLFVFGVVTIFAGFLVHAVRMNLGPARGDVPVGRECPWKLSAMLLVAALMLITGLWLPGPVLELVNQTVKIIGGGQ